MILHGHLRQLCSLYLQTYARKRPEQMLRGKMRSLRQMLFAAVQIDRLHGLQNSPAQANFFFAFGELVFKNSMLQGEVSISASWARHTSLLRSEFDGNR